MAGANIYFVKLTNGEQYEIPAGFVQASVCPDVSASSTYTITNILGTSPNLSDITNFPQIDESATNWDNQTITCTAGDVVIKIYASNSLL